MRHKVVCLVGESGSGKDTIVDELVIRFGIRKLKSYSTRKPRYAGEDTHIFIDREDVEKYKDEIIADVEFHGNYYFSTNSQLLNSDIYIVDCHAAMELRERVKGDIDVIIVYLYVNPVVRFLRMLRRKDGIFKAIKRILHDRKFFKGFKYNYKVKNMSDIEGTISRIEGLLRVEGIVK